MNDEHVISLQTSMQIPTTRLPINVLHRLEEQFPEWREITNHMDLLQVELGSPGETCVMSAEVERVNDITEEEQERMDISGNKDRTRAV
jgi:hypothetical protein